jgi:phosphate-selective porin OprO and OprP
MSLTHIVARAAAVGALLVIARQSPAETATPTADQIDHLQQQIQQLQQQSEQQLRQLEQQLHDLQRQVDDKQQTSGDADGKPARPSTETRVTLAPAKGPEITTADGQTSIQLTSRLQFDAGEYFNVSPQSKFSSPQDLNSGVNARRARLGILGKFMGDWNYALVYDFGGSADSLTNNGANPSGIEAAYVSYAGLRPLVFDFGYQNVPWTLDEATVSTDILFLERASPAIVATNIGAGDFRSAAGLRYAGDRSFAGLWATGPVSGAPHTTGEQFAVLGRLTHQVVQEDDRTVHIGVDAQRLLKAPTVNGLRTLTLSDRPELRIDPTVVLNTGALTNISDADVFGAEAAATYKALFFQSEYYHFIINRDHLPGLNFNGGYAEASWTLTGESHKYVPAIGAYNGLLPTHPFSLSGTGWGAFEIAARYSIIDLNDRFVPGIATDTTQGVAGGKQTIYTAGLNWYPNDYVRFSLNYLHGIIDKRSGSAATAPLGTGIGLTFDAIAVRSQVAF